MKWIFLFIISIACSHQEIKTVNQVDINRFMGKWYVITGRTTFFEKKAFNSVESYSWNKEKERIDIDFTFRKGGFDGKKKSYPQKAWIENSKTNAHWKVRPFWPLKFDYFIIALDPNYQWTAIGTSDQDYLWIMARKSELKGEELAYILSVVSESGYSILDLEAVPQKW